MSLSLPVPRIGDHLRRTVSVAAFVMTWPNALVKTARDRLPFCLVVVLKVSVVLPPAQEPGEGTR